MQSLLLGKIRTKLPILGITCNLIEILKRVFSHERIHTFAIEVLTPPHPVMDIAQIFNKLDT